jgi:hypothetical protein
VAAGGFGVAIGGGNWNGGGWNGACTGVDDCPGEETRWSSSANEGVADMGAGAGWGVCCIGGLKLARSCATFGGALFGSPFTGEKCEGKFCGIEGC